MPDIDTSNITRFEIIDEHGRSYARWNVHVEPQFESDGQTLKIFITPRENEKKIPIRIEVDQSQIEAAKLILKIDSLDGIKSDPAIIAIANAREEDDDE